MIKVNRFVVFNRGNSLGIGDIQIGDNLILRNVSLVKSNKGENFISGPQIKGKNDGKYYDNGFSFVWENKKMTEASRKLQKSITEALTQAYEKQNMNTSQGNQVNQGNTNEEDDLPF